MVRDVALRALLLLALHLLKINRDGDVRNLPIGERHTAGEIHYILNVSWSHDALVVNRDIDKELVERDVLLRVSSDEIVILQASDGQHRSAVELGIIETIQQVNSAGARGCETHS